MDKSLSFVEIAACQLVEKGKLTIDAGLWNGKMGIAIYLLHVARLIGDDVYEHQAGEFIDEVYERVSPRMPCNFGNGLLGIGCGLEYIIEKKFMKGTGDEILQEIDQIAINMIGYRSVDSPGIEKGVCGIGFYLYRRLKNKPENDTKLSTLRLKEHLIYLIDWLEELLFKTKEKTDYNDAYFLLCRLQKLNIFNFKVEKLITFCLQKMIDHNCRVQDDYELLGIPSLKALKPWIEPTN